MKNSKSQESKPGKPVGFFGEWLPWPDAEDVSSSGSHRVSAPKGTTQTWEPSAMYQAPQTQTEGMSKEATKPRRQR